MRSSGKRRQQDHNLEVLLGLRSLARNITAAAALCDAFALGGTRPALSYHEYPQWNPGCGRSAHG